MINRIAAAIGRFCYRFRILMVVIGIVLFGVVCYTQSLATISYTNDANGDMTIMEVFPEDTLVILISNDDTDVVVAYVEDLAESDEHILEVQAYYNTLGLEMTPSEMVAAMGMNDFADYIVYIYYMYDYTLENDIVASEIEPEDLTQMISGMLSLDKAEYDDYSIAMYDFVMFLNDLLTNENLTDTLTGMFSLMGIDMDSFDMLLENVGVMTAGKEQLVGENYTRITLYISYPAESDEIYEFYDTLSADLEEITSEYYLIGNTAMSYELSQTFRSEYVLISIVTAVVIFVIVCLTFRKFSIPVLLVCIIECAIFITMSVEAMIGTSMYFLALIIVQCILMGSMVDYGILLSTYYREVRKTMTKEEALPEVMTRAIRAILMSAFVMIAVTFILGAAMSGALAAILFTLGIGTVAAAVLVIFFLPSLLALLDRLVMWDWYGAIKRRRATRKGIATEGVQGAEPETSEGAEDPFPSDASAPGCGDTGETA
ncbi:MAG: MMPL family transporter [Clostridia bacterium]|nr:MMPL family transporter [Clostridia bacterium]